jgi:hypothetical protein
MAQTKDDLTLASGLIRKGEARGLSPALATAQTAQEPAPKPASSLPAAAIAPEPLPVGAASPPSPQLAPALATVAEEDPPLRALPPDDVAKRFTSFRLPVSLDEDLRAMMFETRRSKQDLLIDFVTAGVQAWRRDRVRRG